LRFGDRIMLFDAGVGTIDNGRYRGGQFLETLKEHGIEPEDVTDVVFTHLHFDHVGWATRKGDVVFTRATYRVHERDWEHFVTGPHAEAGAVRKLLPLTEQLETFSGDVSLAPGVDVRHMPGHTPGSSMFVISDGDERAALIGDIAHAPFELTESDWRFAHDNDAAQAKAAREAVVTEFADTETDVFGAHFPGLAPIRLKTVDGERRWTPSPTRG
jgi:glyoxylase-like metal-dependent hydrolase (beta-lactamase superfamily II)